MERLDFWKARLSEDCAAQRHRFQEASFDGIILGAVHLGGSACDGSTYDGIAFGKHRFPEAAL